MIMQVIVISYQLFFLIHIHNYFLPLLCPEALRNCDIDCIEDKNDSTIMDKMYYIEKEMDEK